jgi:murein DD-endopeptidase MepM/ murein hydrolase activator NlpD
MIAPSHIRIGREQDLSGQAPPRFVRSSSGAATTYSLSTGTEAAGNIRVLHFAVPFKRSTLGSAYVPEGLPLRTTGLTSGFGMRLHPLLGGLRFHAGVDLAARQGDGVFATAGGRVVQAGWSGGYGLAVTIDHGSGLETRYAHLSRLGVVAGEEVQSGEVIGLVGSTGRSTGPHLHYELRRFGRPVDPSATFGR